MSIEFPKRYNHKDIEGKWQRLWEEWGIYRFDRKERTKPTFAINTPPPYPSGDFHVGNALNHTYIDFVARYKRMRGYNVLFPQGWDCHGLPTEVRVEKAIGKTKSELPSQEFLKLCREFTEKWIEPMKKAIKSLGCSIDWTTEYKTMDPDYWRRTQLSFIEMYRKGYVYLGEHPVHWCPRCETALAEAEVEYTDVVRELYYFNFELDDGTPITVASTRPELIPACVALLAHPEDERYKSIIGRKAKVPLYNREIPILSDPEVDPSFGTGVVMVCTYGDKADVRWQKRYNLPVIKAINEKGVMTEATGFLKGLTISEARKRIVKELEKKGLLVKVEKITSSIGTCWRCHTPVEIIPAKQWFVKTRALAERILEESKKNIKWIPPHAYKRLEDWVKSLDWDWTISRKRVFGTPFPVWYCENGHIIVADPSWVPIDPRKDKPPIDNCPHCGAKLIPETDVMDTWMDSSITAAVHAGWPDNLDERLLPADLQPNGYDIIRTWDYYLIVRGLILFDKPQFKTALINGMVRGTDGRMMHKSYGNYVSLLEVIEKYGADAFRLWVAQAAATGSDVRFNWDGLEFTKKFLIKLWNAARLSKIFLENYEYKEMAPSDLRLTDKWILGELNETIRKVTEALDNYDFIRASSELIDFIWHKLCDHYLEAIKYRMNITGKSKEAVSYTLYTVLLKTLTMLSVFTPHICDEIYYRLFNGKPWKSITIAPWPQPIEISEKEVKRGDLVIKVIAEIRRAKHDKRIPLNAPLEKVEIYTSDKEAYDTLIEGSDDIKGTLRIEQMDIRLSTEKGEYTVKESPEVTFSL